MKRWNLCIRTIMSFNVWRCIAHDPVFNTLLRPQFHQEALTTLTLSVKKPTGQKGDTQALERVQRNLLRRITRMHELDYWEQLQAISAYSPKRRRERYLIIYIWRIMEGQEPNISTADNGGIRTKWHIRRGRCCLMPTVSNHSSQAIKSLRYGRFAKHVPRLFNALPAHVRNITGCSVDFFKRQLDTFIRTVSDEPQITGYTAIRRTDSNNILHIIQFAAAQLVSTLEVPDSLSVARGGNPWSHWE